MSLSRTPSPTPNGGWSTPGLIESHDRTTSPRRRPYGGMNGYTSADAHWAAAKAKSEKVAGYPRFQSKNEGFFQRSKRKISLNLPNFNTLSQEHRGWKDVEKLGRGRWNTGGLGAFSQGKTFIGNMLWRFRLLFIILTIITVITILMPAKCKIIIGRRLGRADLCTGVRSQYRRSAKFGGGSKYVIILAANEGGGVMEWKGPREWAIERDSIKNKKNYADTWGYDLEIADMATKKKYAHEWRESWEKVDVLRNCMKKYPNAEW